MDRGEDTCQRVGRWVTRVSISRPAVKSPARDSRFPGPKANLDNLPPSTGRPPLWRWGIAYLELGFELNKWHLELSHCRPPPPRPTPRPPALVLGLSLSVKKWTGRQADLSISRERAPGTGDKPESLRAPPTSLLQQRALARQTELPATKGSGRLGW